MWLPPLVPVAGVAPLTHTDALFNVQADGTYTVAPGVTIDNLQAAGGILDISIGGTTAGTKYDQLNISKTASLNGTLNVNVVNGFVPTVGQTFTILNAASTTGTFSTVTGLAINSTEHFTVTYNSNDVVLTVVSGALPLSAVSAGLRPARMAPGRRAASQNARVCGAQSFRPARPATS